MTDSLYQSRGNLLLRNTTLNSSTSLHASRSHNLSSTTTLVENFDDVDGGKSRSDILYRQFFEVLQAHSNDTEVFDVLQGMTQACRGVVEQLEAEIERGMGGEQGAQQRQVTINALKQEINTWRLLHALYYDRVFLQSDQQADEMMQEGPTLGGSEKEVISQLYAINSTLREYQLVVDWLEACYESKEQENLLHCHDRMMAWENTLFQLENLQGAAFGRGHDIVKSLDPDAPVREKRPLHALDEEDNQRLCKAIFAAIRSGRVDEGLKLCKHYGQTWRAAILEGWRLHEDPNYEQTGSQMLEKLPIEGNPSRDIWKKCAWMFAESKSYDEYTRATAGIFCGHLASLKTLLHSNWHDLLWAYLKVQIDIRVESEIRGCCLKRYQAMPEDYWQGKMTLEQIFAELQVAPDVAVRDYAQGQLGLIQQHLILDTCGELIQTMARWLQKEPLPPHQLRFLSHIVLFLRQIGRLDQEKQADKILAAYVEALIPRGEAHLIAYYTSALPHSLQTQLYSKFLTSVDEKRAREMALEAALQAGLDVEQITKYTVEHIRLAPQPLTDLGQPHTGEISAADQRRILALEWLVHLPEQRGELLWQANAMMRQYLASNKTECVRQIYRLIPSDVVNHLLNTFGSLDNLPPREECSLKEYLCYKVYLAGVDSFNEWTRLQQNPPQKPAAAKGLNVNLIGQDNFTERMASEHKEQTYRSELARWQLKQQEQGKATLEALYNVLMFPEKGWLVDPFIPKEPENAALLNWEHRQLQMEKLRSICLPEIALLLHEVMFKSGDFAGCVRLGDELASEQRQLYKVFTKHKLAELLSKIADASLELLNGKLDPWGYAITA